MTSELHSWPTPLLALALVVSPRLGLQHLWNTSQAQDLLKDFSHNTSLCIFARPVARSSQLPILLPLPKPYYPDNIIQFLFLIQLQNKKQRQELWLK